VNAGLTQVTTCPEWKEFEITAGGLYRPDHLPVSQPISKHRRNT